MAHQLATLVLFTSPLLMIAEHPDVLLNNTNFQPALDVLKAVPSVWDETRAGAQLGSQDQPQHPNRSAALDTTNRCG